MKEVSALPPILGSLLHMYLKMNVKYNKRKEPLVCTGGTESFKTHIIHDLTFRLLCQLSEIRYMIHKHTFYNVYGMVSFYVIIYIISQSLVILYIMGFFKL